jgi:rubredoxin
MSEVLQCPDCGVDRAMEEEAMEEETIWGARGWRCPECGHVWLPGRAVSRDTGFEQAAHRPRGARAEDD